MAKAKAQNKKSAGSAVKIQETYQPLQILKPDGSVEGQAPDLSKEELLALYRWMVEARAFDQRALNLQRQGRLGTYAPLSGQEACQAGSAFALEKRDWVFPSYREHLAAAVHGVDWLTTLTYWGGSEEGSRVPEDVNVFTVSIPIATQIIHAVGMSWAAKIQGKDDASIVYFGDGGTSEGDFHEGLNFAGVYKTATVFFCQNNQYAISLPVSQQTASQTIAQKAIAYGIPGVQVDGNDVFAVYQATHDALERGRKGEGPTLIEAVTYRYGPHTTADDPTRYREDEEVENWREEKDPIERLRKFLANEGHWDDGQEEKLQEDVKAQMAQMVEAYENLPARPVEEIFKYTYEEMPWHLREQLDDLKAFIEEHGDPTEGHH